jgi:hypothetical protein
MNHPVQYLHGQPLLLYILVGGESKFCSVCFFLYQVEDRKLCMFVYILYIRLNFIDLMLFSR